MRKTLFSIFFLFFFIYIDAGCRINQQMKIYTYQPQLFKKKAEMTEAKAYATLSKYPIEKNLNYAAIPWAVFYNMKKLFKKKLSKIKLSKKKLNEGFTVCQHIKYIEIIPTLRRLGVNILFAPHALKKQEFKDITVLPFPIYPTNGINPAKKKDILYSFIGFRSHPVREKIFSLKKQPGVVIKRRQKWHFHLRRFRRRIIRVRFSPRREQEKKEYQDVLARSRFSLCPRGTGPSTIRFWESLQAGAIPVLLSDAIALPKINGINWDDCIIRVPEKDVSSVDKIIRAISSEREEQMREKCLHAYTLSCAGKNFVQTIKEYFEKKA